MAHEKYVKESLLTDLYIEQDLSIDITYWPLLNLTRHSLQELWFFKHQSSKRPKTLNYQIRLHMY